MHDSSVNDFPACSKKETVKLAMHKTQGHASKYALKIIM